MSSTLAAKRMEESLDARDWGALGTLAQRMVDDMFAFLAGVCTRPAWRPGPHKVRERGANAKSDL